jgi:hypothetical protein
LEEPVIQQTEAATLHGPQGSLKSNIGIDQLSDQALEGGTEHQRDICPRATLMTTLFSPTPIPPHFGFGKLQRLKSSSS